MPCAVDSHPVPPVLAPTSMPMVSPVIFCKDEPDLLPMVGICAYTALGEQKGTFPNSMVIS